MHFYDSSFLLQITYCFQKLQLLHENMYLQAYEMFENNHAHIRKKTSSDIYKNHTKSHKRLKYILNSAEEDKSCGLLTAHAAGHIRDQINLRIQV